MPRARRAAQSPPKGGDFCAQRAQFPPAGRKCARAACDSPIFQRFTWHAAGVTERVHVCPLRPKSQISASSPKGGAKARFKPAQHQSLHRLRGLRPKRTAQKPPPFTGEVAFAKQMTEGALQPSQSASPPALPKGEPSPLSHRLRGDSAPINGGAFGAVHFSVTCPHVGGFGAVRG